MGKKTSNLASFGRTETNPFDLKMSAIEYSNSLQLYSFLTSNFCKLISVMSLDVCQVES